MGKRKDEIQEEEVKTLTEVEKELVEKDEELISDESATSTEAPAEETDAEEIKKAFEETEMPEEDIEDGLEHITPETVQGTVVEPVKELLEDAKEVQKANEELLDSLKASEPEKAVEEINSQISKIEGFKKRLQDSFKKKTTSQIIHSWNGANYPF